MAQASTTTSSLMAHPRLRPSLLPRLPSCSAPAPEMISALQTWCHTMTRRAQSYTQMHKVKADMAQDPALLTNWPAMPTTVGKRWVKIPYGRGGWGFWTDKKGAKWDVVQDTGLEVKHQRFTQSRKKSHKPHWLFLLQFPEVLFWAGWRYVLRSWHTGKKLSHGSNIARMSFFLCSQSLYLLSTAWHTSYKHWDIFPLPLFFFVCFFPAWT